MVSDKTIERFREAVKAERGIELSTKEAKAILLNLVGYFDLLSKIYHRDQTQKSQSTS